MMNLQDMYTDDVYFEDDDSQRIGPYKTKFGGSKIIIYDKQLNVTEGFIAIQPLPNGTEQRFSITDVSFSSGLGPINPHFTMQIEKESNKKQQTSSSPTFHINNSNVQVGDGNVQNIINSFEQLITAIESSDTEPKQKEEAKSLLKTLLSNPTVSAVLGGSVSGLLSLL